MPVIALPPRADIILIQRKEGGRTEEQRLLLADGLGDLETNHILVELKITENLDEETLPWLSMYETLYRYTAKLERHQLRAVIISLPDGNISKGLPLSQSGPVEFMTPNLPGVAPFG